MDGRMPAMVEAAWIREVKQLERSCAPNDSQSMVLEIPENIEKALGDTPEESKRRALECILLDAYKKHKITKHELRETLGLSWFQTEDLLACNGIMYEYSVEDLEKDFETNT